VIRTLAFYLTLLFATLAIGTTVVVASLLGVRFRPGGVYDRCSRAWGRWSLSGAGLPIDVQGAERVPAGQPVVFAVNHSSLFDILVLFAKLPGSVRFVAKRELARIPFFGTAMVRSGNVVIDRANPRAAQEAYQRAADRMIAQGVSAIVFPEGTRSRTGDLLPFKAMPFGLAIAAGVPVVPVYVHNTFQIMPKGAWRLRRMPVRVRIGDPIPTTGRTLDDRDAVRDATRAVIEGFRARVDALPLPG
jgi:1-acyl-sn-glycerol-3-phosphate acyltransferase